MSDSELAEEFGEELIKGVRVRLFYEEI